MKLQTTILCAINRHEPIRNRVNWNGRAYQGTCSHCGRPIKRIAHRKWRRHDPSVGY